MCIVYPILTSKIDRNKLETVSKSHYNPLFILYIYIHINSNFARKCSKETLKSVTIPFFFQKNIKICPKLLQTLSLKKKKSSPFNIISRKIIPDKLYPRNKSSLTFSKSNFPKKRKTRTKKTRERIAREARWDLGSIGTAEWMARGAAVSGIGWLTDSESQRVSCGCLFRPPISPSGVCTRSFRSVLGERFKDRSNSRYLIAATTRGGGGLLFTTRLG